MNTVITFGKFQGWTPLELAQAGESGRGYLRWGSENLKSPKWREAFAEALRADVQTDTNLAARALVRDSNGAIDYEDALELARAELADAAETQAFLQGVSDRQAVVVAHWAPIMAIPEERLRGLAGQYEWSDWDQLPASRFSSAAMHANFLRFMAGWMAAYDETR